MPPRPDLPPPSPADLPPVLPRFLPAAVLPPIMPSRPAEGFMRPVWYLDSLDIYAPYNPPNTAFSTKNHPGNLCKKTSPVPPKGGRGNGFGPIDGPEKCRYHPRQAEATRPAAQRTAQGHHGPGDQKGEVNMTTPTASELLVQQAREAERLRLLLLASECKDLDEFRQRLRDLLNK